MSQQSEQSQPNSVNDDFQERKRKFFEQSIDNLDDSSRTVHSLLFPGSIDWYVLRQFLFLFFAAVTFISVFYIIMDFLNSSDVFIQKCHQHNVPIPVALYQFYMPRLLAMFDSLLSVFIIVPGIVLINQMIKRNETIALACMGIRRVRAAYMIFAAAIVLIVFFAFCREFILPSQRTIIGDSISSFFEREKSHFEPKTDPLTSVYFTGDALDIPKKIIIKPVFHMPMSNLSEYGQRISAEVAIWQDEVLADNTNETRPAGYLLKKVVAKKCLDNEGTIFENDKPVLYTPLHNEGWLEKGDCFLVSGIEIEDLTINVEMKEYSSIFELRRIMERMPSTQRTDASIIIHKRIVRPFIDFCVIFVGLSFILANENRILVILLKVALWWLVTWIIINMTSALAGDTDQLLTPAVAAWLPLITFAAVAAYVWDKVYY